MTKLVSVPSINRTIDLSLFDGIPENQLLKELQRAQETVVLTSLSLEEYDGRPLDPPVRSSLFVKHSANRIIQASIEAYFKSKTRTRNETEQIK